MAAERLQGERQERVARHLSSLGSRPLNLATRATVSTPLVTQTRRRDKAGGRRTLSTEGSHVYIPSMGISRNLLALIAALLLWAGSPGLASAHDGHHAHHQPAAEPVDTRAAAELTVASAVLVTTQVRNCDCPMTDGECLRSQCHAAPVLMAAEAAGIVPPDFVQPVLASVTPLATGGLPDPPQRPPSFPS